MKYNSQKNRALNRSINRPFGLSIVWVFLSLSWFNVLGQEKIVDKVIAKVGGEYILYSELMQSYKFAKERSPQLSSGGECFILDQLIGQKLLINQAKLDSITIGESEVETQLDYRINEILSLMNGDETMFEQHYEKSIFEVKNQMREELRQQLLAQKIQQQLIGEVNITPKEVVQFFQSIPKDSLPYLNAEVEIGEIVIMPEPNDTENLKAMNKLSEIRSQIISGKSTIEEMAKLYSMDGSAASGGDLGWQKRGTFVPEFEAVAYNLNQGEISEIVETEFGFHLIKLEDRRGNSIKSKHVLIRPEITAEDHQIVKDKLERIKMQLELDSIDFQLAVKLNSNKKVNSYNNNGMMTNPATGDNFFQTGDLAPEIYFAVEELEVGQISDVLESSTPQGETIFKIVKLVSRTKPHRASLELDYSRIQNFAKESKKNEYFNQWMLEKMETTFIQVDDKFATCPSIAELLQEKKR